MLSWQGLSAFSSTGCQDLPNLAYICISSKQQKRSDGRRQRINRQHSFINKIEPLPNSKYKSGFPKISYYSILRFPVSSAVLLVDKVLFAALQYISMYFFFKFSKKKIKTACQTLDSNMRPTSVLLRISTINLAKTLYLKRIYSLASISFADNGSLSIFFLRGWWLFLAWIGSPI